MPRRHATLAAGEGPPQGAAEAPSAARCSILLPLPLAGAYDYAAPGSVPPPGTFVTVPLGGRTVPGVVWDGAAGEGVAAERLRPIAALLDVPPMPEELRRFVDWVAAYTMTPPGAVLRMAMSVPAALAPPRPARGCAPTAAGKAALAAESGLTAARRRVLSAAAEGPPRGIAELARAAGCGAGVVRGLLDTGFLRLVALAAPS